MHGTTHANLPRIGWCYKLCVVYSTCTAPVCQPRASRPHVYSSMSPWFSIKTVVVEGGVGNILLPFLLHLLQVQRWKRYHVWIRHERVSSTQKFKKDFPSGCFSLRFCALFIKFWSSTRILSYSFIYWAKPVRAAIVCWKCKHLELRTIEFEQLCHGDKYLVMKIYTTCKTLW